MKQRSLFGKVFAVVGPRMDARGALDHRGKLVEKAHGVVIEIGAGYGATFALYPETVSSLLALEPDPALRDFAEREARECSLPIRVEDGRAESIPAVDCSVDVVVSSLVLCSVADQRLVIAEIERVLKPGGLLLFYEHVRSTTPALGRLEDLATPLWRRAAGGCHPNRDTVAAICDGGLVLESSRRFGFSVLPAVPAVDHVLGSARKPG